MLTHSRQPSLALTILGHNHPQKIGPWRLGKTLGRGATGRVLLATHDQTGQKAAVKVVLKLELGEDEPVGDPSTLPYGIEREIIIMKLLTHPNVLRLYDVWETSKALYLVLEYVEGGELFDLLVERGPLHEQEAIKYFRQIILGTAYCHALGICHRDLKPENLLLDANLNVKLADFGMAALEANGKLLETSCGLPHYAAPEIVLGLKYHGAASDVWSCGVILFALLTGRLPFDDENIRNLLLKVQAGQFEMPYELSADAQDLIDQMLTVDPIERITTEHILTHPLLTKYPIPSEDLISVKLLPHPETAYKLLGTEKNIDRTILENLMILWKDRDAGSIVDLLLAPGPNPEKTFYALLLRYRSNDELAGSLPRKLRQMVTLGSWLLKLTPKRRRQSQIAVLRPLLFQYLGLSGGELSRTLRNSLARLNSLGGGLLVAGGRLAHSLVNNSPYKLPSRSPAKRRSPQKDPTRSQALPAVPRNIYQEIVDAQYRQKLQPETNVRAQTINYAAAVPLGHPSPIKEVDSPQIKAHKFAYEQAAGIAAAAGIGLGVVKQQLTFDDSLVLANLTTAPTRDGPPIVDEIGIDLLALATIKLLKLIESLLKSTTTTSKVTKLTSRNRLSIGLKRRLGVVTVNPGGLKRNLITMKLLLTYSKLAEETDWEYVDKLTKRTSATFAHLCDKIFNQEEITKEEEDLMEEEERQAREYEQLMEKERKKHEAELIARRELEKHKKRQRRRSLMSLKKLSIMIKEDDETVEEVAANDTLIITPEEIAQLKKARFGGDDLQSLLRRATPNLQRRPVLRLDPLWTAYENNKLERAKDALDKELKERRPTLLYDSRRTSSRARASKSLKRHSSALGYRKGSDRYRYSSNYYDGRDYDEEYEDLDEPVRRSEPRRSDTVRRSEPRRSDTVRRSEPVRKSDTVRRLDDRRMDDIRDDRQNIRDRHVDSRRDSRVVLDSRRDSRQYPDRYLKEYADDEYYFTDRRYDYDRRSLVGLRKQLYPVSGRPPHAPLLSEESNLEIIDDLDESTLDHHRRPEVVARKASRKAIEGNEDDTPSTLIASVNIPRVTRQLRHMSSSKRLSVLLQYSTKDLFRDLSLILNDDSGMAASTSKRHSLTLGIAAPPAQRTSYSDRFDDIDHSVSPEPEYRELVYRELGAYYEDDLRGPRYYDSREFRELVYSRRDNERELVYSRRDHNRELVYLTVSRVSRTVRRHEPRFASVGPRPRSQLPGLPDEEEDDDTLTFEDADRTSVKTLGSLAHSGDRRHPHPSVEEEDIDDEAEPFANDLAESTHLLLTHLEGAGDSNSTVGVEDTAATTMDDTADYTFATHKQRPRGPRQPVDEILEEGNTSVFEQIKLPQESELPVQPGAANPVVPSKAAQIPEMPRAAQKIMGSHENPSPNPLVVANSTKWRPGMTGVTRVPPPPKPTDSIATTTLGLPKVRKLMLTPTLPKPTVPPTGKLPSPKLTPKPLLDATNKVRPTVTDLETGPVPEERRNGSLFFRKMSWGSKKVMEDPPTGSRNTTPGTLPPQLRQLLAEPKRLFFRWFSLGSHDDGDIKRFDTILPRPEMQAALMLLLTSWLNFGVKDLREDKVGLTITGGVSKHNSFNLKSCKFRIKVNSRDYDQKSLIVCVRVKGLKTLCDTLFAEIEKVLVKENVLDV